MSTTVFNGPFIGKAGNVVGARSRGMDFRRRLSRPGSVAPSEKQLKQRQVFAIVSIWLNPLRELIKIGFQQVSKVKMAMNEASQLAFRKAELLI